MKPVVICVESVDRASCQNDCVYTIDVMDESEVGTPAPSLRFHIDARTSSMTIDLESPYPTGPMEYSRYRKLVTEERAIETRLFALPEVVALQKKYARSKGSPPCQKPQVGLMLGAIPGLDCKRGKGCCWQFESRTMNGCVASTIATFEVDSPTGEIRIESDGAFVPYARWHSKKSTLPAY